MNMQIKTNGLHEFSDLSELQKSIVEFISDRKSQNLSPTTIRFYKIRLIEFDKFCRQSGVNNVLDITPDLIRMFIMNLQDTGHNSGGVHT